MSDGPGPPELDDPDVYRTLVEGIPAIVYIDKPDQYSTSFYISPQTADILGYPPEEWIDNPDLWLQKLHPDDLERVSAENDASNASGDPFFSEYRLIARDGRVVWFRDQAVPVRADDGTPLYWRGVMLDITEQKRAEEKLRWSLDVLRKTSQQRRELMHRLEHAQAQERRRIASDIHDDPIQVMSAVDLRLQTLAMGGSPTDPSILSELHGTVQRAIERLRHLLFELRPTALDRDGLVAALRLYLEHIAAETGLGTTLDADGLMTEPQPDLRATLFRLAQEALANVRKHAAATRIGVGISTLGAGVSLRVSDDGEGFDPAVLTDPEPGHLGLATMMERAEVAGGWCRVSSAPGVGTTVEFWLPLEEPGPDQP